MAKLSLKNLLKVVIHPIRHFQWVQGVIDWYFSKPMQTTLPMIVTTEQLHPGDFDRLLGTWIEISQVGLFKENRDVYFWIYGANGELLHHNVRHINNVGLFSQKDYRLEKEPGDFLICVLGDEQSTSTLNEVSWPELLEDLLNADVGFFQDKPFKRFKVLNYSWPDSGFPIWAKVFEEKIAKLSPDLVILNFLEHSFERLIHGKPATLGGKSVLGQAVEYRLGDGPRDKAYVWVACSGSPSESGAPSLRNAHCNPASTFQVYLPKEMGMDPSKMAKLREMLVADLKSIPKGKRDQFSSPPPDAVGKEKLVTSATSYLRMIAQKQSNFLIARNFFACHLNFPRVPLDDMTKMLIEKNPDLNIILMRDKVPQNGMGVDVDTWYLPHDHSKWSYEGHKQYASLLAHEVKVQTSSFIGSHSAYKPTGT